MGAASSSLIRAAAVAAALLSAHAARADSCTGISSEGGRFAACFDVGNRLSLTLGTAGYGGSVAVRHTIDFVDEPDLVWKMEHAGAEVTHDLSVHGDLSALLYRGRFLRHARDGHIVLPIGSTPKKIFLPFDIGGEVEVGRLRYLSDARSNLGIVETAMLVDFARTRDFRTRFAFGPVASWDVAFDHGERIAVADQRVAPFSALLAEFHVEGHDGLTFADLRVEAGTAWHTSGGWAARTRAEASFERVLIAVNDRPVALFASAVYDSETGEAIAGVGLRVVVVQHRDPRVSLDPPKVAAMP